MAEGKRVLAIVGIGCGVLALVTACGVGACLFAVYGMASKPAKAAKAFFADARANRWGDAFKRMDGAYEQTHTAQQLEANAATIPAIDAQTDATFNSTHIEGGIAIVSGVLATPRGPASTSVDLKKIGGYWYITSITVKGHQLE